MFSKYFSIEKRSHHFLITDVQGRAREVIENFAKQYIQYSFRRISGRWKKEAVKIWASRTHDAREYRFHINQYAKFIAHLDSVGLNESLYSVTKTLYFEAYSVSFKVRPHFVERDYQIPIVAYLADYINPPLAKMLEIQTGRGKGNLLSTRIKTPGGWTTMGEIKVGDTITAWDGSKTKVNGVYPQGKRDLFKFTFWDDRVIEVDDNHLWKIYRLNEQKKYESFVLNARQIILKSQENVNGVCDFYVDFHQPERDDRIGRLSDSVDLAKTIRLDPHMDHCIPENIREGTNVCRRAFVRQLFEVESEVEYGNRLTFNGTFKTNSEKLAKDVQFIVRSLGQQCFIYPNPEEFEESYVVVADAELDKLPICTIEQTGVGETQCISIEHPDHLYIVDDFIVTHNTFCALKAGEKLGQRIMAVLKPTYMDKWVSDFTNIYDMEADRIWSITGAKNLKLLLKEAIAGTLDVDAIVISSHTILSWISDYNSMKPEHFALAGWPCCPDKLYEVTGCGLRIVDEAHQEFHLGFMVDLFTHVGLSISLSATMKSDDQFLNQMYELVYPKASRYANLPYIRFIHSYAWKYRFDHGARLKYSYPGATTYSHNAFEESILKSPVMLQSYLELIGKVVKYHYLDDDYQNGDRCLVYASSIHMCDIIHKYLKKIYSSLDVRRYVDDDPYDNLMQAEICVSTVGSAGTGHDISKLTTVVLTPAIKSTQSNIQGFGRLRETPGRKMKFAYLVCLDSDKHVEYHIEKASLLKSRALTHQELEHMSLLRCT